MILRIEAALCEPPSSITAFRDATLYSTVFAKLDVLLRCELGTRSIYWQWLKKNGAHDFVKSLILPDEEVNTPLIARKGANIRVDRITTETLPFIIDAIRGLKQDSY